MRLVACRARGEPAWTCVGTFSGIDPTPSFVFDGDSAGRRLAPAIGGTRLAAAALTVEGTTGNLAEDAAGAIPLTEVRLVNGLPLPIANLELGPAVQTQGGTRWEVCLTGSEEFHRVAFGLIAPTGTYTAATQSWTVGPLASAPTPCTWCCWRTTASLEPALTHDGVNEPSSACSGGGSRAE